MGVFKSVILVGAITSLTFGAAIAQAQCSLPHTMVNGQPADASKLMANFNALASCINSAGGTTNSVQYNAGTGLGGVGPLANGQLVIGSTGNAPQAQTLTAGSGIAISNNPGAVSVSATNATGASGLYRQMMSATPTAANTGLTSWLNQGASTASDNAIGFSIDSPSSASVANMAGRFRAAPSAPYTIKALVAATRNDGFYSALGMGWFDGTAKLHLLAFYVISGGAPVFQVQRWNSVTSYNGIDFQGAANAFAQPIWFQLKDDGTNISFAFSHDGANFLTVYSVAKSTGFLGTNGYSNVIFFNDTRGARGIGTIMSWTQE